MVCVQPGLRSRESINRIREMSAWNLFVKGQEGRTMTFVLDEPPTVILMLGMLAISFVIIICNLYNLPVIAYSLEQCCIVL